MKLSTWVEENYFGFIIIANSVLNTHKADITKLISIDSTALTASLPQSHSHSKIINGDSFKCSGKQATSLQSCKEQSTALVMQDNSCPNSYGFAAVQCKGTLMNFL